MDLSHLSPHERPMVEGLHWLPERGTAACRLTGAVRSVVP